LIAKRIGDFKMSKTQKAPFAWMITKDHICEGEQDGLISPTNWCRVEIVSCPHQQKFKMYDDDGILYYDGIISYDDPELMNSEIDFSPLDDFGTPNAGCTSIRYLINGSWEIL